MDINNFIGKAQSGDANAQYELAEIYYNGQGVEQSYCKEIFGRNSKFIKFTYC